MAVPAGSDMASDPTLARPMTGRRSAGLLAHLNSINLAREARRRSRRQYAAGRLKSQPGATRP